MINSKIILDLCGGTGSWSKPYADAGYGVILVTLPDYDVTKTVLDLAQPAVVFHGNESSLRINAKDVHGILAAPPCTMFSLARRTAKLPPDFEGATAVVKACQAIIMHCRAQGSLKFWAMENPMGLMRQFIGRPAYNFQPWWFGDDSKKSTDLWGYFNEPKRLKAAVRPEYDRKSWGTKRHTFLTSSRGLTRADIRSITPPNFAKAFMRANQ